MLLYVIGVEIKMVVENDRRGDEGGLTKNY